MSYLFSWPIENPLVALLVASLIVCAGCLWGSRKNTDSKVVAILTGGLLMITFGPALFVLGVLAFMSAGGQPV